MLDVSVFSNIPDMIKLLDDIEKKQVPYAMFQTINAVGAHIRDHEKRRLDDVFTVRRSGHLAKSLTFRRVPYSALKSKATMIGEVGTFARGLYRSETGGRFNSHKGHGLFTPNDGARVGGSRSGALNKRLSPKKVMARAKGKRAKRKRPGKGKYAALRPFVISAGSLPNNVSSVKKGVVFIRRFQDKRLPLVRLYSLSEYVDVPKQWGFRQSVTGVSDKVLARRFVSELKKALAGSRESLKEPRFMDSMIADDKARNATYGASVMSAMGASSGGVSSYSSPFD